VIHRFVTGPWGVMRIGVAYGTFLVAPPGSRPVIRRLGMSRLPLVLQHRGAVVPLDVHQPAASDAGRM
jgi:hypothetical protein